MRALLRTLALLWAMLALAGTALAQRSARPPQAAEIDRIARAALADQHIPGMAVAVLRDGRLVYQAGYGFADVAKRVAVTPDTGFSIASVSKQFIATAVMLLVQEGRIDLDAPATRYLTDAPPSWSAVTIRQMLSHTGGLVREVPAFAPNTTRPLAELVRSAYPLALQSKPGEKHAYSNTGYFALAEIISRVSGRPWADFIARRMFAPSGMRVTVPTNVADPRGKRALGYDWRGGQFEKVVPYKALRPSGAFVSTVTDLAKWEGVLANGSLLTRDSRRMMQRSVLLNDGTPAGYGLGWRIESVDGRREVGHGGVLPGFRSHYARYPESGLAVIVLTNSGSAEPSRPARAIARAMLK